MSFVKQIRDWNKKVVKTMKLSVQLFLVDFSDRLLLRTPIGDPSLWAYPAHPNYKPGTLINSWFFTLESPYTGDVRAEDTSASAARSQARTIAKLAAGAEVFITNPTPYFNQVEYVPGWSKQAPQGMTRITIAEFPTMIRAAEQEAKKRA